MTKTSHEFQNDFWKNYSMEKLFIKDVFSKKRKTIARYLIYVTISIFAVSLLLGFFKTSRSISLWLMTFASFPILLYILYLFVFVARKSLKRQGFKLSKDIFKPITEEIRRKQIRLVYKAYRKVPNQVLLRNIDIAKDESSKPINNPFVLFEKFFLYFGKTVITIIIALLLHDLYIEYSDEKFYSSLKLIFAYILLLGLVPFIWNHMFKIPFLSKKKYEKKRKEEFIHVFKNVLLLRAQEKRT